MVARKMRDHCATCWKQYPAPRSWAYCSARCEENNRTRRGLIAAAALLRLEDRLNRAMPWEREKIANDIDKLASADESVAVLAAPIIETIDDLAKEHPEMMPVVSRFVRKRLRRRGRVEAQRE